MAKLTAKHMGDMLFEVETNGHKVDMDVPESMGGKGRAMSPPQVTMASLGGCIAAFVTNYCKNVGIDTTYISVDVEFEKGDHPACLKDIKATINIPHGDIAGREQAILKVASSCPVDYTLCHTDSVDIVVGDK